MGDSKTGTTALQRAFVAGREAGMWCYPGQRLNHNALAARFRKGAGDPDIGFAMRAIWDNMRAQNAAISIISAEYFQSVEPAKLAQAIARFWPEAGDRLALVSYVRPHIGKLIGMYCERLKAGRLHLSLGQYAARVMEAQRLDYAPRLAGFRRSFGTRFVALPYVNDHLRGGDVVADFFDRFLPGARPHPGNQHPANPSFSRGQVQLMRRLRRAMGAGPLSRHFPRVISLYIRELGLGADTGPLGFSVSDIGKLQARYLSDAQLLERAHWQNDGFEQALFTATPGARPAPLRPHDIAVFDRVVDTNVGAWRADPEGWTKAAQTQLRNARFGRLVFGDRDLIELI
ncbi:MAG: hypothetical protein ACU0A2_05685 [Cognatishimia sp.]|uniref:hypothetical protein n=1 Tax=Cognatishimia sp. TaxID=2211648 RepID=UPI004059E7F0